jgi:catechol 2,3-dioxygenase-like lactoylglutathione lyase family enzyme
MSITGIDALVFGVADVEEAHRFLNDWGLERDLADHSRYTTRDGCELFVRHMDDPSLPPPIEGGSTVRQVIWGVRTHHDLPVIVDELADFGATTDSEGVVQATDPTGLAIAFRVSRRFPVVVDPYPVNAPGTPNRIDARAPFYDRAVPTEISHVVFGVPDIGVLESFYVRRLGFMVSDRYTGRATFMRAAAQGNHHHLFALNSADNAAHFLHVCFKVRDIHEVIGGGQHVLKQGWTSQAGPGRHFISSACFWYFATPFRGAFEYAADEDIVSKNWIAGEHTMTPEMFSEWTFHQPMSSDTSMPLAASRAD